MPQENKKSGSNKIIGYETKRYLANLIDNLKSQNHSRPVEDLSEKSAVKRISLQEMQEELNEQGTQVIPSTPRFGQPKLPAEDRNQPKPEKLPPPSQGVSKISLTDKDKAMLEAFKKLT